MSAWARGLVVGATVGVLAAVLSLTPIGTALEEQFGLPVLFDLRGLIPPPPKVAVISIGKQSADQMGLPAQPRDWPRSLHGQLIDRLNDAGAAVIVFDLAFDRPQAPSEDRAFADAIERSHRVILYENLSRWKQPSPADPAGWVWMEEVRRPISVLADAALAVAPFALPKVPARVNQYWPFLNDSQRTPTLPAVALQARALNQNAAWMAMLRDTGLAIAGLPGVPPGASATQDSLRDYTRAVHAALKADPMAVGRLNAQLNSLGVGRALQEAGLFRALYDLYTGPDSRYLNFYGPAGTIQTIPYATIIEADKHTLHEADLNGAVVFVGYSELTLPSKIDGFDTVFSRSDGVELSGVEIAATAFANLIAGQELRQPGSFTLAGVVLAVSICIGLTLYTLPSAAAVPAAFGLAALYLMAAYFAFADLTMLAPVAVPLFVLVPVLVFVALFDQYLLARRRQRWAQEAISCYVPARVVSEMATARIDPRRWQETAFATCLATDAVDFTSLSERLSPAATAEALNAYFDALAAPLDRHGCDFHEFHADGLMCAWLSPQENVAARRRACLAALDLIDATDQFNRRNPHVGLGIRVGLHAGQVFIGHIGAGGRFAFRVVGDIVNTASRIEGLNRYIGTRLLASEAVVAGIDDLLLRPVGRFRLKGKRDACSIVEIVTPLYLATHAQRALVSRFNLAMGTYQTLQWSASANDFENILTDYPNDGPSRFFISLCSSKTDSTLIEHDGPVIRMRAK